jgi:hypothetical protein
MPKGKYGEYSPKQKKIAAIAGDPKVLEGEDFKALGKKNKKAYGGSIKKMKKGGEYKSYDIGGEVISGNCNRRRGQYS